MALTGSLVQQISIKSDGDMFYEIFRYRLYDIPTMAPDNIRSVDLLDGDWGTVGSVIFWTYFFDGKEVVAKDIIEAVDGEKKSLTFKVIEGDLMDLYKHITVTVQVDTSGEDNLVTWTLCYEKLHEGVPEPTTMTEFGLNLTKDIETYCLKSDEGKGPLSGNLVNQSKGLHG